MNSFKKILLYVKIVMPLLFIAIGLFYIFIPNKNLDQNTSRMIGGIAIAYGLFRGYRAYRELQDSKTNE